MEGISIRLPSPRERVGDVPYIFSRLLHASRGGSPPAVDPLLIERLCLYDWPLNVRELVTLVRRLLVMHGPEARLKLLLQARPEVDLADLRGSSDDPGAGTP